MGIFELKMGKTGVGLKDMPIGAKSNAWLPQVGRADGGD